MKKSKFIYSIKTDGFVDSFYDFKLYIYIFGLMFPILIAYSSITLNLLLFCNENIFISASKSYCSPSSNLEKFANNFVYYLNNPGTSFVEYFSSDRPNPSITMFSYITGDNNIYHRVFYSIYFLCFFYYTYFVTINYNLTSEHNEIDVKQKNKYNILLTIHNFLIDENNSRTILIFMFFFLFLIDLFTSYYHYKFHYFPIIFG